MRQNYYSVPAHYADRRLPVRLSATTVEALDGARVIARHQRAAGKYGEVLTLDHYLCLSGVDLDGCLVSAGRDVAEMPAT